MTRDQKKFTLATQAIGAPTFEKRTQALEVLADMEAEEGKPVNRFTFENGVQVFMPYDWYPWGDRYRPLWFVPGATKGKGVFVVSMTFKRSVHPPQGVSHCDWVRLRRDVANRTLKRFGAPDEYVSVHANSAMENVNQFWYDLRVEEHQVDRAAAMIDYFEGELEQALLKARYGLYRQDPQTKAKAKKNPSRRKRRAPRRGRRNPLASDGEDLTAVLQYVERGVGSGEAEKALAEMAPDQFTYSYDAVETMFPQRGKKVWSLQSRVPEALTRYDFISRLRAQGLSEEQIAEALQQAVPFRASQAQISLEEAQGILEAQRAGAAPAHPGPGNRRTLQASSAICKMYRSRRLTSYAAPPELARVAGPMSVVIWMSPQERQPRIITYRRGAHLDCDMVGDAPAALVELLGKAIQSAMLWVVEKPKGIRKASTVVYVGRVGDPYLYVALRPDDPVNLDVVTQNLVAAQKGVPGFRVQLFEPTPERLAQEVSRYDLAMAQLFGKEKVRQARRPTMKTEGSDEAPVTPEKVLLPVPVPVAPTPTASSPAPPVAAPLAKAKVGMKKTPTPSGLMEAVGEAFGQEDIAELERLIAEQEAEEAGVDYEPEDEEEGWAIPWE